MNGCGRLLACLAVAVLAGTGRARASDPAAAPAITAIAVSGEDVIVTIEVPEGVRRITVSTHDRLGHGGWLPLAVRHLDGAGGTVTVTLPRAEPWLALRVTADEDAGLPAAFFDGPDRFAGEPVSAPAYGGATRWYGLEVLTDGGAVTPTANPETEPREVVESDIWKIRDGRLYFFNQYRGLQVVDVADPDAPALLGTLPLPAAGEQMYVLDERHVVLLVRNGCGYGSGDEGACLVVDTGVDPPAVAATVPVAGQVLESRLVGQALYVASAGYLPTADGSTWAWRTTVASLDLADPLHPVPRQAFTYPGHDPVFIATDRWLFAALRSPDDYRSSVVHAINIASPAGAMWEAARLPVPGQVPDQFKMQLDGDVFTVIYETRSGELLTRLETYRFLGALGFWRLGSAELAAGERLFATRFDGDRVYIVTFEQVDPLWVVSLADPARPAIVGELEVPGFSTYIQPLGDRLVSVGREGSYVAVSLFGVADPADPVLLDRVLLGEESWWSASEATFDEKAFGVLEAEGLVLLPFEYTADHRWVSAVQLVDLGTDALAERGRIEHGLRARRATVLGDRILSVSGRELAVVDAADRDRPVVTATLPLSWPVDRLFGAGDYLVELAAGHGGYNGRAAGVVARVVEAADPAEILAVLDLGPIPLAGAAQRDGRLYLAQAETAGYPYLYDYRWALPENADGEPEPEPETYPLQLSVFDLARLPDLPRLGTAEAALGRPAWGQLEVLWPRDGLLVWSAAVQYWPLWLGGPLDIAYGFAPWYGSPECRLLAFDVADPARPAFRSDYRLPDTHWLSGRGSVFAADGAVYTSHSPYLDGDGLRIPVAPAADGTQPVPEPAARQYLLDVVDYEDPAEPTLRPPAELPGMLSGVSHGGSLLYTVAYREAPDSPGTWQPVLDALAYDGIAAHHVAARPLPEPWTGWIRVVGPNVLAGYGSYGDTAAGLQVLTVSAQGGIEVGGETKVPGPVYQLVVTGDVAAAQAGNQVLAYAAADLPAFRLRAAEAPAGCIGYALTHAHAQAGALYIPLGDYGAWTLPLAP